MHILKEELQAELREERKLKSRLNLLKESGVIGEEDVSWIDMVLCGRNREEGPNDTVRVLVFDYVLRGILYALTNLYLPSP